MVTHDPRCVMKKRLLPTIIFLVYSAILVKVMVFKDIPPIKLGQLMLNFGGTDYGRPANFIPFKTIFPYLLGDKGYIIAGINLAGNIAPLIPLGILFPFVYRNMTWKKSLAFAVVSALIIELMQVVLRVGIFDIDDVILNALGVMIGYWLFTLVHARKYKTICITASILIAVAAATSYAIVADIKNQPVRPDVGVQHNRLEKKQESKAPQSGDPCGGTGGNGIIVTVEKSTFIMKRKDDGKRQKVTLTKQASINTAAGIGSIADLKEDESVTLVGGPNPDGSFTAEAVFVCNGKGSKIQSGQ